MDLRSRMFPYPILREQCIDYNISSLDANLDWCTFGNEIEFNINVIVNNEEIKKMIENRILSYVIQLECAPTSFRELYKGVEEGFNIRVPFSKLCDKVEVSCFIVAENKIRNFIVKDFNDDYEGMGFELEKGSLVGIGSVWNIDINKDKDELGKLPSIFSVVMKKDLERDFEINLNQDKIKILLAEENFIYYKRISKSRKNEALIHSLIVLPALIYVFDELISSNGEGFEYRWKIGLGKSLAKYKIDIDDIEKLKCEGSVRLAQLILEMPMKRAFENLSFNEEDGE